MWNVTAVVQRLIDKVLREARVMFRRGVQIIKNNVRLLAMLMFTDYLLLSAESAKD